MTQPFVGVDIWGVFATLANTFILYLIVKKFLYAPVKNMIKSRENEVLDTYDKANAALLHAQNMKEKYQRSISKARDEAMEITKSATKNAHDKADEIIKNANDQAQITIQKAQISIDQQIKNATSKLKEKVLQISLMIASKVIEKDINERDHEGLISSFIDKMGDDQ